MTAASVDIGRGREAPFGLLLGGLGFAVLVLAAVSVLVGRAGTPLSPGLITLAASDPATAWVIFSEIRLPRALLGAFVGASLGLAGAVLQGLLRNPLAEPGLIGASSGAALAAVVVLYFGLAAALPVALPLAGMAGALAAVGVLFVLAGREAGTLTLILAGVAINSLAGALTALALNLAPSPYAGYEIMFWLMGSLADRSFEHVWLMLPMTLAGWVLLLSVARPVDALALGAETARSLGFDLRLVNLRALVGTALCVGAAVAVSGVVGFVGLVVPHLLRPFVDYRPGRLLPVSMLGGAALLLAADIVVRSIAPGPELRLGVVTAFVGAPFFLWLLVSGRRSSL